MPPTHTQDRDPPSAPPKTKWRWPLETILPVLAGGASVTFFLYQSVATHGWAQLNPETGRWFIVAHGWSVLAYAWPPALLCLLLGAAIGGPGVINARIDLQTKRKQLEEERQALEQQRKNDKEYIARQEQRVEASRQQLLQEDRQLKADQASIAQREQHARDRIAAAEAKTQTAKQQTHNAVAATNSRRKQVEKLRQRLQDQEQTLAALHQKIRTTMVSGDQLWASLLALQDQGIECTPQTVFTHLTKNRGLRIDEEPD